MEEGRMIPEWDLIRFHEEASHWASFTLFLEKKQFSDNDAPLPGNGLTPHRRLGKFQEILSGW